MGPARVQVGIRDDVRPQGRQRLAEETAFSSQRGLVSSSGLPDPKAVDRLLLQHRIAPRPHHEYVERTW